VESDTSETASPSPGKGGRIDREIAKGGGEQIQADPGGRDGGQHADESGAINAIYGALKRRGVLVVLGMEPSNRPDGLFDLSRKERQRDVRFDHGLAPLYC
jgi:hypothetical protein